MRIKKYVYMVVIAMVGFCLSSQIFSAQASEESQILEFPYPKNCDQAIEKLKEIRQLDEIVRDNYVYCKKIYQDFELQLEEYSRLKNYRRPFCCSPFFLLPVMPQVVLPIWWVLTLLSKFKEMHYNRKIKSTFMAILDSEYKKFFERVFSADIFSSKDAFDEGKRMNDVELEKSTNEIKLITDALQGDFTDFTEDYQNKKTDLFIHLVRLKKAYDDEQVASCRLPIYNELLFNEKFPGCKNDSTIECKRLGMPEGLLQQVAAYLGSSVPPRSELLEYRSIIEQRRARCLKYNRSIPQLSTLPT